MGRFPFQTSLGTRPGLGTQLRVAFRLKIVELRSDKHRASEAGLSVMPKIWLRGILEKTLMRWSRTANLQIFFECN